MRAAEIARSYLQYWIDGNQDAVRAMMKPDLRFRSPMDAFDNAEDFLKKCWSFSEHFHECRNWKAVANDNECMSYYEAGDMRIVELYQIEDDLIAAVEVLVLQIIVE